MQVDTKALTELKEVARRAGAAALAEARDRGKELLRSEVPGGPQGSLGKGVTSADDFTGDLLTSSLIVSALNENRGGAAVLHLPNGATKQITLRGGEPYDYAEAVARGTGMFGPDAEIITPLRACALLIKVDSVPAGEAWIAAPGGKYILRRASEGMPPNPYDQRAADRLEQEVDQLVGATLAREGLSQ